MPLGPVIEKIKQALGDKVRENVLLAPLTSYRIGGPAQLMVTPTDEQDLVALMETCAGLDIPIAILGGGTNILVGDAGIRGITINMAQGFKTIDSRPDKADLLVTCGASLLLADVLEYCIKQEITGFEFASGIPGTLGGAIRGNAGTAHGAIADVLHSVNLVTENGARRTLKRKDLTYRYRGLELEGRSIVTGGVLLLKKGSGENIREKRDKIIAWRRNKQPWDLPSAGSTFINPPAGSAGRMIEQAGCKGMTVGGAQVSQKHANFIVNTGTARAADVMELIDKVRRSVFEKFGVLLETEIKFVGENR